MMRRIGFWLAFGAAAAGVVRIGWPGTAASPVTLVNRVDVITIVLILTGLPWAASRLFGRVGSTRTARAMRTIGYAVIFALVLVKASVERFGIPPQGNLAGSADPVLWAGENVFLLVMAAYNGRDPRGDSAPVACRSGHPGDWHRCRRRRRPSGVYADKPAHCQPSAGVGVRCRGAAHVTRDAGRRNPSRASRSAPNGGSRASPVAS